LLSGQLGHVDLFISLDLMRGGWLTLKRDIETLPIWFDRAWRKAVVSASLAIWIVKHWTALPLVQPSRTTERVMGGSTGSGMKSGAGSAAGSWGEERRAGEGEPVEVVFFFLLKKPMVIFISVWVWSGADARSR
jgi:hypothetical protein